MKPPRVAALLLTSAFLLGQAPVHASEATQACVSAYEDGQVLRKEGKLTRARERLLVCAQASCSPVLRKQCTGWVGEVDQQMPTVVLVARGPAGADVVDVHVTLDGQELTRHLDGKAMPLDPGPHTFRFEIDGAPAHEERVLVSQGEHERRVTADFHVETAPVESTPTSRGYPVAATVFGGIGLLGLTTFAVFGLSGSAGKNDLDARQCKPGCPQDDVDAVKRKFLVADIGLVVGGLSAATAIILLLTRGSGSPAPAEDTGTVTVSAAPVKGGATVGLQATF